MTFRPFRPGAMAGARSSSRIGGARQAVITVVGALLCSGLLATSAFAETLIPYQVQAGDTIWDLAGQFATTVDDITSSNSLSDPNNLAIGQFLLIKSPIQTTPATSASASSDTSSLVQLPSNLVFRDGDVTTIGAGSLLVAPRWAPRQLAASPGPSPSVLMSVPSPGIPDPIPAPVAPAPVPVAPPPPPILAAPYYSQFDGSVWGPSNCGPSALAMALGSLGMSADPMWLRHLADVQMHIANPYDGTTWESLAYAARSNGTRIDGLYAGKNYRTWSIDDLKSELTQGRPVILLVRYWNLPDHGTSDYSGDHYILALGFNADGNLVYNDPAFYEGAGAGRVINQAHLMRAWSNTAVGFVRSAMALYR